MATREATRASGGIPASRAIQTTPKVSVVVALGDRPKVRADRVRQLLSYVDSGLEVVIVASAAYGEALALLGRRGVSTTVMPEETSREELRAIGMRRATGDVVIVLDDDRLADGRWRTMLSPFLPELVEAPVEMQRYPA